MRYQLENMAGRLRRESRAHSRPARGAARSARSAKRSGTSSTSTSGCSLIAGRYFDGHSAAPRRGAGSSSAPMAWCACTASPYPSRCRSRRSSISDRVGNITRRITLPGRRGVRNSGERCRGRARVEAHRAEPRDRRWCTGSRARWHDGARLARGGRAGVDRVPALGCARPRRTGPRRCMPDGDRPRHRLRHARRARSRGVPAIGAARRAPAASCAGASSP